METKDKEKVIYAHLEKLKNGNHKDRLLAFECIGYLSNEYIEDSLELRLDVIREKLENYKNENN